MRLSETKFYKPMLVFVAIALFCGVSLVQKELNRDRKKLGLTRVEPLENAPPVLAFTTVALGGFRGLIANALWIRMNDLQDEDKFFEMVQLADWITKLEPHFTQVWLVQGWNMAYNVSVKFRDPEDRWRWVQRGIELLRDQGLKYNPDETLIYRELSWFFQHKMGQNLDDAHWHYKTSWYTEMNALLGKKINYPELLNPTTPEAKERVRLLREKYKLDPQIMKEVDEKYGPLEWRLPDAHAIYWAEVGRRRGKEKDQNTLMRSIYQTMQQSFRRGAIYESKINNSIVLGPNLDGIANVNKTYEDPMMSEDESIKEQPKSGHKNFLLRAVEYLYLYNRRAEAQQWYKYLNEKYPTAVADYIRFTFPDRQVSTNVALDDYVVFRVTEGLGETDVDNITAVIGSLIQNSFIKLIEDDDEQAVNYANLAQRVWERYQEEIKGAEKRIKLPPLEEIRSRILSELLEAEGLPPEAAARLRTKLGLPAPVAPLAPGEKSAATAAP